MKWKTAMTTEPQVDSLPTPDESHDKMPSSTGITTDLTAHEAAELSSPASVETPSPMGEPVSAAVASAAEPAPTGPAPEREGALEEPEENFAELLSQFEKSHARKSDSGQKQLQGTVVSLSPDQVFFDIGYKTEGVVARANLGRSADTVRPGDSFPVSVKGRNEEGYYELSLFKVAQPRDWSTLEAAFADKTAVVATVTGVVKGGLTVDVGVRAFMPASRSGTRDAAELEKLVGTEITCRITKLDVADEDVVVDRRVVLEEQARGVMEGRRAALNEGDIVGGTVRSLMPYGAFIDLGGIDGLLHISDMAHSRVQKPEDLLAVGQQLEVKILKIDAGTKKISLGLKQLQAEPWATVPARYEMGQRVSGTVTRLQDFGAFVEIEPGVEGLVHISEMSWAKKVRHPSDLVKEGDRVEAVILGIKPEERRISLGLKHAMDDPWSDVRHRFPENSQVEGPVTKLMNFGAFVQLAEGIEGLVHVSEIVADRRINHPSDVLRVGQPVKALVLAIDTEKRQIKLSMKQLIPTSIDEYIAEHKAGDRVSGRVVEVDGGHAVIELGEGIRASCRAAAASSETPADTPKSGSAVDLSSLSSQLSARWKGKTATVAGRPEPLAAGQIRSFKIVNLDAETKRVEVELA
jgi:small subunit ribosomal protein S1